MKIKCLIIDDEPSSQTVLKKFVGDVDFLELAGVCNNAIEAIEKLKLDPAIQLLFLDINMPIMNGWQFLEQLELINTSAIQDIKVVILTSSMSENDKKKSEAYKSVKKYVTKPLLANAIGSLMESL